MKKILLLAIIYIACFANAKAYFPPDSCLQVVPTGYDDNGNMWRKNSDSLKWDTCDIRYSNQIFYGITSYQVVFNKNIIPRNFVTVNDSTIHYTLSDILPIYSELKDSLISLSASLGTFTIMDKRTRYVDTTSLRPYRHLELEFYQIHNIRNAQDSISYLPFVEYCISNKWVIISTNVSEAEVKNYEIKAYPNPTNKELILEYKGDVTPKDLEIIDEKGVEVFKSEFKNRLDISFLPKGVYFVKINNQIEKFIKE
jgi:hypothetical protein